MKTIKEIIIRQAEGKSIDCQTKTFSNLEYANQYLKSIAYKMEQEKVLGYYKTNFKVVFEDDEKYNGVLNIESDGTETDIIKHIKDFLEFESGKLKPSHLSNDVYKKYISKKSQAEIQEIDEWLNKYIY